jgi:KaiC/GvpD/RAD55 family RecA-like ATPase
MDAKEGESWFGVDQLDNITLGKMAPGSLGIFNGPVGTGKSSMLYHLLFEGAKRNENVCLITNEPPGRIANHISSFNTHQPKWLKDGYISVFNAQDLMGLIGVDFSNAGPDEVDLFLDLIVQMVTHLDAKRLVIDPFNPVLDLLELWEKQFFIQGLKGKMSDMGVTTFIAMDSKGTIEELGSLCLQPYIFDMIVQFEKEKDPPVTMNTMTIQRWKGSAHARNTYVIDVSKDGVILVPRIKPLEVR